MDIKESASEYTIENALREHTLSEQYFFGYTTSRHLLSQLDKIVIEPYISQRNEYIYIRNHNVRTWVDGTTKHVEVPSVLLAQQVEKVHRQIAQSDNFDFDIDIKLETSVESLYKATDSMVGSALDSFYRDLEPAGHVVFCRPEELLVELIPDSFGGENFLDDYIESSSKYLRRIDDSTINWEDAYEPYCGMTPKFQHVDRMLDVICDCTGIDVTMATDKDGVFRGYRFDIGSRTLTLLCRGWGRDMTHAMMAHLLDFTTPESVLFMGGCGALNPELDLNDFVVPEAVHAPDGPVLSFNNVYAADDWVTDIIDGQFVQGTAYNVDSPADETNKYMVDLRASEYQCVSMEFYGVAKALEPTNVPFGVLLFVMDCPLRGIDLGSTNYDPQKRSEVTFFGNSVATKLTAGWHGLLDHTSMELHEDY